MPLRPPSTTRLTAFVCPSCRQALPVQRPRLSPPTPLEQPSTRRPITTSPSFLASTNPNKRSTPRAPRDLHDTDRGPTSREDTQTDFGAMNVLGATPAPTTSIDECSPDGFLLDSGLRIGDGAGVLLIGAEAFVWRPWMAASPASAPPKSTAVAGTRSSRAPLLTSVGALSIPPPALGLLRAVWPRPDLLVVGTGRSIRPLDRATREALQELGFRLEVLDTRNAASQFNLLATERGTDEVAAILLPEGFGGSR